MQYGRQQSGDVGRVVLCSATDCDYNQDMKCFAQAVHVHLHGDHADCNTYTKNQHPAGEEMEELEEEIYY